MLTGNFFISVLGGIVLFGYVPAVAVLFQGLMQMFFVTMDLRISGIASGSSTDPQSPIMCR